MLYDCMKVVSDSLWPHGLYNPWNSLGQNTGVDSLSLLQGIFPTKGSNPGLTHCRQILYQLSHKGSTCDWICNDKTPGCLANLHVWAQYQPDSEEKSSFVRSEKKSILWGNGYLFLFKCKYQFNCVLFHSVVLIVLFLFHCFPVLISLLIVSYIVRGEGNGNPLQYSYLDITLDRGAWWAAGHIVSQSQIQLKQLSMRACIGEGNGNPLQYSCLENPRNRGVWGAAVYGVTHSRTRLKRLSSNSSKGSLADY